MSALTRIVQQAEQLIVSPPKPDAVLVARCYFGEGAWSEVDEWRATGSLPRSYRGLELLAVDLQVEEET